MEPSALYESPFTDMNPLGISGVFGPDNTAALITILEDVRGSAAA
jgi:type I restriction enzyme R subunit